jgi:protocatechuate 3,4-dioxygenase beta subunit
MRRSGAEAARNFSAARKALWSPVAPPGRTARLPLMRKGPRIGVILGGAALLVVAVFVVLPDDYADQRAQAPAIPTSPALETPAAGTIELAATPAVPTAVASTEPAAGTSPAVVAHARLSGRVTLRDEKLPVAGVRVSVETFGGDDEEPSALTDADGRYVLDFTRSADLRRVLVEAGPATTAVRAWFRERLAPPAERTLDLQVTHGAQVSGRVLDEKGAPVIDALVRSYDDSPFDLDADSVPQRETRTDTAGHYSLATVGAPATILAAAPGRACAAARSGSPAPGHSYADVDLRLVTEREIAGIVVDEAGAAVAKATLAFQPEMSVRDDDGFSAFEPWPWPTSSDSAGRFTFDVASESTVIARFELQVEHSDFAPWSGRLPADEPAKIVLLRGAELSGLVLDELGAPVAGAELSAVSRLGYEYATSGADGSFRIAGLPAVDKVALLVHGRGHAIQVDEDVALQADGAARHDVHLQAARVLAGLVSDDAGHPVPGAHVAIEGDHLRKLEAEVNPPPTWESWLGISEAVADDQGRFRFDDLYEGSFKLEAFVPTDEGTKAMASTRTPDAHVELVLPDAAASRIHLVGRITDSRSGAPIEHASFAFMACKDGGGWSGPVQEVSAPGGQYDLLGPMAGIYRLSVTAEGHGRFSAAPRDFAGGVERMDINFDALRSLLVQVVRADGSPVPRAVVVFHDADGSSLSFNTADGLMGGTITDERGELQVSGLPARKVNIDVRLESDVAHESLDLSDERLQTTRIVLEVKAVRTINVGLCLSRETIAADIGKDAFRALVDAGRARPYVGPATLTARDSGGTVVARASAEVEGDQLRVDTEDTEGTSYSTMPAVFTDFRLTIPASALTLELEVPGRAPWHSDVPAGSEPVHLLASLPDG